jgi:hypothetical protein
MIDKLKSQELIALALRHRLSSRLTFLQYPDIREGYDRSQTDRASSGLFFLCHDPQLRGSYLWSWIGRS